jgi:hypothetical protein
MEIPELTASQIELLYSVAMNPDFFVFAQHQSLPTDLHAEKIKWDLANADALYLTTIGLLKDISAENTQHLEQEREKTGRNWLLFEVPRVTQLMFGPTSIGRTATKH